MIHSGRDKRQGPACGGEMPETCVLGDQRCSLGVQESAEKGAGGSLVLTQFSRKKLLSTSRN